MYRARARTHTHTHTLLLLVVRENLDHYVFKLSGKQSISGGEKKKKKREKKKKKSQAEKQHNYTGVITQVRVSSSLNGYQHPVYHTGPSPMRDDMVGSC